MYQKDYKYNSIESILNQNSKVSGFLQFLLLQQREVDFIYIYIYIYIYSEYFIDLYVFVTVLYTLYSILTIFLNIFSNFFLERGLKSKSFLHERKQSQKIIN